MYGYVRPLKGELKVSDYEAFQAVYCGLCHALKRRGGPAARFAVNYDLTFLAMLLSETDKPACRRRRCPVRPLRKKSCLCADRTLDAAADLSLLLAWWKLKDGVRDKGVFGAAACRLGMLLLGRARRRAAEARPGFAAGLEENLRALWALEDQRCPSLDAAADRFARILRSAAADEEPPERRRALEELLYHLGRFVYILDVVDDLADDAAHRRYNPLLYRFTADGAKLSEEETASVRATLNQSQNRVAAAFALLPPNAWQPILANTIYLGLPATAEAVLTGRWRKTEQNRTIGRRNT